jgi:uncharacterized repeat protein (TIGR03803 family)
VRRQKSKKEGGVMKIGSIPRHLLLAGLFALAMSEPAFAGASGSPPPAITEQVLYKFCPQVGCTDGTNPAAGLIMDASGNLYGTTSNGGSHAGGTVFKLAPSGTGWSETVLYNFCSQTNCPDGYAPQGSLILDGSGYLYGIASAGGNSQNLGLAYRLAPSGTGWVESVLYTFCALAPMADIRTAD